MTKKCYPIGKFLENTLFKNYIMMLIESTNYCLVFVFTLPQVAISLTIFPLLKTLDH